MEFQIFFFSAFFLVLCGIFLSFAKFASYFKFDKIFTLQFINHKQIGTIIGIVSLILGIIMVLRPIDTTFIGDIIPALLSIVGGLALIISKTGFEYNGNNKFLIWMQEFIKTNIAIIGLLMVVFGLLHAIFPNILLL